MLLCFLCLCEFLDHNADFFGTVFASSTLGVDECLSGLSPYNSSCANFSNLFRVAFCWKLYPKVHLSHGRMAEWIDSQNPNWIWPYAKVSSLIYVLPTFITLCLDTEQAIFKIRGRIKTSQSRQKSYADTRRWPLEFEKGDYIFLKVSPIKGVVRFEKKEKSSPRYTGPFEILGRVGAVAYQLALPPSMSGLHNVFHVSMLRKYAADPCHILRHQELQISPAVKYEEQPV